MVFQEPMTSLDPLFTIGSQIVAGIVAHQGPRRGAARELAAGLLERVGIPTPAGGSTRTRTSSPAACASA